MKLVGNWSYPTAIRFGAGRIAEIADACATAKIQKPLLVTDRGLASFDITNERWICWNLQAWGVPCLPKWTRTPARRTLKKAYGSFGKVVLME